MSAASPGQTAATPRLEFVHTQLGFDLLIDPGDYLSVLLSRDGLFEAPETDLVTRLLRSGDTCIDAGCHLGYYSCLAAKLVGEKGRVYSFDANPQACQSTRRNLALNGLYSAEVIQTALADQDGERPFHVSTDDQTGLSSLGPIPSCKQTISVSCLRLDEFLKERHLNRIRLLKLDVEGAEEIVLRGLGRYLADYAIDFILVECFDERLRMLNTSTANIAGMLKSAGYKCWEFGTDSPSGWSQPTEVRSRGDCNYLFSSPSVTELLPSISLAAVLYQALAQRGQLQEEGDRLRNEITALKQSMEKIQDDLRNEITALKQNMEKIQDDNDWLMSSIKTQEENSRQLAMQNHEVEILWEKVQNSAGWRMLNRWREFRNRVAAEGTWLRKLCDSVLQVFRPSDK